MFRNYCFLVLTICLHFAFFCLALSPKCLDVKSRVTWDRNFNFNDNEIPIVIDVSSHASHQILSNIVKILLHERLGYKKIEFEYYNENSVGQVLDRLSCINNSCVNGNPLSHINVEIWLKPGYSISDSYTKHVVECGPLGPTARKGVFIDNNKAGNTFWTKGKIIDNWRIFTNKVNCQSNGSDSCFEIVYNNGTYSKSEIDGIVGSLRSKANVDEIEVNLLGVGRSTSSYRHQLLYDHYPSVGTVQGNFTRILFPDCLEQLLNRTCAFEVHQLSKIVWTHLKEHADKAFHLIKELWMSPEQYVALLSNVNTQATNERDEYYRVACAWLRGHQSTWEAWTPDWDKKDKIYLPILVSDYEIWSAKETMSASLFGIKSLNDNVFNGSHYEIVPRIHELMCDEDLILSKYLNLIQAHGTKIMGFIVSLCPRTFNSLIKISDMQHRIILSSSMESTHSMNLTEYKYFFSTQPNMYHYNLFLIKMFRHLNWTRVVILKKDEHLLDEKILPRYHIKVLSTLMRREDQVEYGDIYEFLLVAKHEHKASIFIVDYLVHGTQIVICAAGNLGMTLAKGYVFILNPLYESTWLNNYTSSHCPQNDLISQEIFVIKHDINTEHIDDYVRTNPHKYNVLAQMTKDAVLYLGNSFHELITQIPSAYFSLQIPPISEKYVDLLANRYQIMLGPKKNYKSMVFNKDHGRNGIWKIQKVAFVPMPGESRKFLVSLPLFKWNINNGFETLTGLPNVDVLYPIAALSDRNNESDCQVELLRHLLGWSCTSTQIFINVIGIASVISCLIAVLMWYYRRQAVILEDRFKKPFEELCTELADIDIRSSDVVISLQVGKGAFGIVYGGEAKRNNRWESVAIKLIKKEADYQGKIDFLTEAKLMRNLEHPNIVKLIGICLNPLKPAIYLVMELVVNGDLEDYLLTNRITAHKDPHNKMVCPSLLTRFVKNIASGAQYLHQNSLIHRDLACRNFFLSEDYIVKIGDFGLTRNINEAQINQYYRTTRHFVLPARWMPPEAVQFGYFSVQSDIWSLGVVIFEVATFCSRPYFNVTDEEVPEHVKRNAIPLVHYLPSSAKESHVYKLVERCCQYKRDERPRSMADIVKYLEDNQDCIQAYITNNPPQTISMAVWNLVNPYEGHQRPSSVVGGGLIRFKSTSKSRTSVGNLGLLSDSHSNFDAIIQTESDTGRVAYPSNPDKVPFIPNEAEFITVDHNTNRIGSKKKHKSSKKLTSNLNTSKSRSSDFMINRFDDDQEPSYVSCPDAGNIHCFMAGAADFDVHDFPFNNDISQHFIRSASGDDKSIVSRKRRKTFRNGKVLYKGSSRAHRNQKGHPSQQCGGKSKWKGALLSSSSQLLSNRDNYNRKMLADVNGVSRPDLIQPLLSDATMSNQSKVVSMIGAANEEVC